MTVWRHGGEIKPRAARNLPSPWRRPVESRQVKGADRGEQEEEEEEGFPSRESIAD
jgi:hypothetical protein